MCLGLVITPTLRSLRSLWKMLRYKTMLSTLTDLSSAFFSFCILSREYLSKCWNSVILTRISTSASYNLHLVAMARVFHYSDSAPMQKIYTPHARYSSQPVYFRLMLLFVQLERSVLCVMEVLTVDADWREEQHTCLHNKSARHPSSLTKFKPNWQI